MLGRLWRNESAFRGGNIVWGRVVPDIPDYCRELIKALKRLKSFFIPIKLTKRKYLELFESQVDLSSLFLFRL